MGQELATKLYILMGDICCYQQDNFEQASLFYQRATIPEPVQAAGAYWNLGKIWYREGHLGEVTFCKNKAAELLPELKKPRLIPITFEYLPDGWTTKVPEITGYDTGERSQSTLESWKMSFQGPNAKPLVSIRRVAHQILGNMLPIT